jgi:hypothetical protein
MVLVTRRLHRPAPRLTAALPGYRRQLFHFGQWKEVEPLATGVAKRLPAIVALDQVDQRVVHMPWGLWTPSGVPTVRSPGTPERRGPLHRTSNPPHQGYTE